MDDIGKYIQQEIKPYSDIRTNNPAYQDLVDQVNQNNTWSAVQAEKQMQFQEKMVREQERFNSAEASVNRMFQQESADRAMDFSSAEAEKNRDWQEMMSNTAHQREMKDLQKAGLNPILAANNGASAGAGSAALSAQAAGYGASSSGLPSGSKGDADQSGAMAIANLMGKMLDNQTEIQKMITSAETARETAEMYTGATRYAAELASIASQIGSERSLEASRYAADMSYASFLNNPYNLLGHEIGEVLDAFKDKGISAGSGAAFVGSGLSTLFNKAQSIIAKVNNRDKIDLNKSHISGKF